MFKSTLPFLYLLQSTSMVLTNTSIVLTFMLLITISQLMKESNQQLLTELFGRVKNMQKMA